MNGVFVLDACALIALLAGEPGAEKVRDIINDAVDGNVTLKIKSKYKIPLGDSIAGAESITGKGTLVTSDHTDFERLEISENVKIRWFR